MRFLAQFTLPTALLLCLTTFPQTQPEQTLTLIFLDHTETITESQARTEHKALLKDESLTATEHARFVALVHALGTIPNRCTAGQVYAGLCLPEQLETEKP